jgi:hypothetical protein
MSIYAVENGHHVIHFLMVSFDNNWHFSTISPEGGVFSYLTKVNGATLQVVVEGPTGVLTTYTYKASWGLIPANTEPEMAVIIHGRVIQIPTHCSAQISGNTIKCQ